MQINQFLGDLVSDVRLDSEEFETFVQLSFTSIVYEKLLATEDLPDLDLTYFKNIGKRNKNVEIHGFGFDSSDSSITLLITDFHDSLELSKINQTEVNALVGKARGFYSDFVVADLGLSIEPSSEGARACRELAQYKTFAKSLRVCVISNRELSSSVRAVAPESVGGLEVKVQVWDLKRLFELELSKSGRLPIEIDLLEFSDDPIPVLVIPGNEDVNVYLFAINGKLLAKIFDEWGSRLLESNVRSYLSLRTAVNKGIRDTISSDPQKFLPFNNGITATAESVKIVVHKGSPAIRSLNGLQIVNGGQTTSSIYNFYKSDRNEKSNLEEVFVQVKLIEVEPEKGDELVPAIARYANSQNKVAEADFFSNSTFHRIFEKLARQTPAPPKRNELTQTYWYYERARGQYNNEKSNSNRQWVSKNPPSQKIDKTDLAKFIMCWEGAPHLVSRGAQKNFVEFAKLTHKLKDEQVNTFYFKKSISLAMIYMSLRKRILKSEWYKNNSGYLANIVAYSISLFASRLSEAGKTLDFSVLWNQQEIPESILEDLENLAQKVRIVLIESPNGMNVTEFAKNEECWLRVQKIEWKPAATVNVYTQSLDRESEIKQVAAETTREINYVNLVSLIYQLDDSAWLNFESLVSTSEILSPVEINTFKVMRRGQLPQERALKVVPGALDKLYKKGFSFGELF